MTISTVNQVNPRRNPQGKRIVISKGSEGDVSEHSSPNRDHNQNENRKKLDLLLGIPFLWKTRCSCRAFCAKVHALGSNQLVNHCSSVWKRLLINPPKCKFQRALFPPPAAQNLIINLFTRLSETFALVRTRSHQVVQSSVLHDGGLHQVNRMHVFERLDSMLLREWHPNFDEQPILDRAG